MDDLTNFLKQGSGGPADLDWLDVDEVAYRALDTLPKQNLDIVPDLKGLWRHHDEPASNFVPNTGAPRTLGDLSQLHVAATADVTRTARLALVQTTDPTRIKHLLDSRFDLTTLRANRTALASVLAERGLLGSYYIDAVDFPTCAQGSKQASEFVRKYAKAAPFLKAKTACGDCVHRKATTAGSDHCSVFHKEIVLEVPYSEDLADAVEQNQGQTKQAALKSKDKQVIDAFYDKKPMEGPVVKTDGKKLESSGGSGVFAKWEGSKVKWVGQGATRTEGEIRRYMTKSWPKNTLPDDVQFKSASTSDARSRIKAAYLSAGNGGVSPAESFTGRIQVAPKKATGDAGENLIALSNLTKKRDAEQVQKLAAKKALPIITTLRREMLKGRGRAELVQALKLAFDPRDLAATREHWEPLFKEAGLYGVVYSTQDSFDDCRTGADFLSKHGSKTRAIVAGAKCESCIFSKVGRCMMYGKKLVNSTETIITPETVVSVLDEQKLAGHLPHGAEKMQWGKTAREALKRIHDVATGFQAAPAQQSVRANIQQAFYGSSNVRDASSNNAGVKRDLLKVAAQFLNEGLYGDDLLMALRGRFLDNDIKAAAEALKPVLAEQGLQGITFIDPAVYDDYGKGCKEAGRKHRSRKAVRYAKVAGSCTSCVHQSRPGFCSVLDKQLVVEPPYVNKQAEQAAVLNSGPSTTVSFESLVNNGLTVMQEYELQHGDGSIDLSPKPSLVEATFEFGGQSVKL